MLSRRKFLIGTGCAIGVGGVSASVYHFARKHPIIAGQTEPFVPPDRIAVDKRPKELAYLARVADPGAKWGPEQLFNFLNAASEAHLGAVGKALEIADFDQLSKPKKLVSIHKEMLWRSSHVVTYPFKSLENINYHDDIVVWCSEEVGIPKDEARFTSTFDLERQILRKSFENSWDQLNQSQRRALLQKIDSNMPDVETIVAMSGATALGSLALAVYVSGFAFYTTMSVVISTIAAWFGVTVSFTAYMAASSTVAALAGPIGWTIGAVLLAGAITKWAGQADVRKATDMVLQLHCLKAGALYGAGNTFVA